MIGIYKVTNLINGKVYIGQSINIDERWKNYRNKNGKGLLILALKKYGLENFKFEVLEECEPEQLNQLEIGYIQQYNSNKIGYNILPGGQQNFGENNPRAKLTVQDVIFIRELYESKTDLTKKEIYEMYFQEKVGWRGFEKAWSGDTWVTIKPEVYRDEIKNFYLTEKKGRRGEKNAFSAFTDEEVMTIRNRYINEAGTQIYADYADRVTYGTLERLLLGQTYSHLPIYKKSIKTWINK